MIKINCLASSSRANCFFIKIKNEGFFIDCGLGLSELKTYDFNSFNSDMIFYTHSHSDHAKGAGFICTKGVKNVYATRQTIRDISKFFKESHDARFYVFEQDKTFSFKYGKFKAIKSNHDCEGSVNYIFNIDYEGVVKRICFITDSGKLNEKDLMNYKDCDIYIVESNYDYDMQVESGRDISLIYRVISGSGHLSNKEAAQYIEIFTNTSKKESIHWVAMHLSKECNQIEKVKEEFNDIVTNKNVKLNVMCPYKMNVWFDCD